MIEVVDDEENMDEDILSATKDPVKWACEAVERMFTVNPHFQVFLEVSNTPSDLNAFYIGAIREGYGSILDNSGMDNVATGICTRLVDAKIADPSDALFIVQQVTEELKNRGRYEVMCLAPKMHVNGIIGAHCYVRIR